MYKKLKEKIYKIIENKISQKIVEDIKGIASKTILPAALLLLLLTLQWYYQSESKRIAKETINNFEKINKNYIEKLKNK